MFEDRGRALPNALLADYGKQMVLTPISNPISNPNPGPIALSLTLTLTQRTPRRLRAQRTPRRIREANGLRLLVSKTHLPSLDFPPSPPAPPPGPPVVVPEIPKTKLWECLTLRSLQVRCLEECHSRRLIYVDVKPDNFMLVIK